LLRRLLADELNGPEAEVTEAHIEGCAACQQALEQLTSSDAFRTAGPTPAEREAAELRLDQRRRWQARERVPAEDYLRRHPPVAADPHAGGDLIYGEFLLREQLGERPTADEYARRFPEHA